MTDEAIPIEALFPEAEYIPPREDQGGNLMELLCANLKTQYTAERDKAVSNLELVKAEGKRLKEVILRLEGAIGAVEVLEKSAPPAAPPSSDPEEKEK